MRLLDHLCVTVHTMRHHGEFGENRLISKTRLLQTHSMVKAHSPAERKVLSAGWQTPQSLRSDTAVPQVHKSTVASVNDL